MSKNDTGSYQEYLASLHAKNITPDEVIQGIVKEGTGKHILAKRRIVAGEVNEVYDLTLSDKTHGILRISRNGYPDFQQEQWAIDTVKKVGVPVPDILFITYKTVDREELAFCLMQKVEGEPLERGGIDFPALPKDLQKSYIVQAGELLSKIHSIKTQGYGWVIGERKTEYETGDILIDEIIKRQEELYQIATSEDIDTRTVGKAIRIVDSFRERYRESTSFLNHGDYGHKHFMVKGNQIVAILDWGGVRSDTPVYDFASWDYWFGNNIPTAWLKEGYENKALFDGSFDDMLHFIRIMKGIEIIAWYKKQQYHEAVLQALKKLLEDISYFS